jgi:hypothetical protein
MPKKEDIHKLNFEVTKAEIDALAKELGANYREIDRPFLEAYIFESKVYECFRDTQRLKNMMELGVALGITQKGRRLAKNVEPIPEPKVSKLEVLRAKPKVS